MSDQPYSYAFLRYRQNTEAGEFANIGVALWAPESRFLGFQGSRRFSRLTHFFGDLDKDGYRLLVAHAERRFDLLNEHLQADSLRLEPLPESVRELALQVVPEDEGSVFWSSARGGVCENPNAELAGIYSEFIGRFNDAQEHSRRDDGQVFRETFRPVFADTAIAPVITEHRIEAPLLSHVFKTAWKNGVWNVYETLSFDLLKSEDIEAKASKWLGRSINLKKSPENPRLHFLLGRPSLERNRLAYGKAKDILAGADVDLIEEDAVVDFQNALRKEVHKLAG